MSSLQVVAALAAVGLVVFGPGLACCYPLGLRGLTAWALAPSLSCTVVGLGGAAAALAGIRWSPWLLLALTAASAVVAALAGRLLRRAPDTDPDPDPDPGASAGVGQGGGAVRTPWAQPGWTLAGIAVGAVSVVAGFAASIGSVSAVPAQPDATYHLNSIRSMLRTGDVSSLDGSSFLYHRAHSFYPSTFHGLAATAGQLVDVQPVVLANLLAIVSAAAVWVPGCVLLCRQALGRGRAVPVFAGLAAAAYPSMPYWMGGYGVLWPYLLALSLVPALLACVLRLLRLGRRDLVPAGPGGLALVVGVAGLPFTHPDAFAALVLAAYVLVVVGVVGVLLRRRAGAPLTPGVTAWCVAGVGLPLLAWWAAARSSHMRAMSANYARGPEESVSRAVREVLLGSPRFGAALWVTSAIALVGLVACARRRSTRWVPAMYVALGFVFVGVAAIQSGFTRAITVYWYNDSPRLAAMLPLAGVPALAAGLLALARWGRGRGRSARSRRSRRAGVSALVAVGFVIATVGNNQAAHVDRLRPYYSPAQADRALLPSEAPRAFARLATSIPAGAVVADNPWRGHALLYAFTGRQVLFASEKALSSSDNVLLATDLYLAGTPGGSDICAAVRRTRVTMVLTGGDNRLLVTGGRNEFRGIDLVAGAPGFVAVARAGDYTLWRITACD